MACNNTRMNSSMQRQPVYYNASPQNRMPEPEMEQPSLAVASVVRQPYGSKTYSLDVAFVNGTIYPSLNKPYTGRGGSRK